MRIEFNTVYEVLIYSTKVIREAIKAREKWIFDNSRWPNLWLLYHFLRGALHFQNYFSRKKFWVQKRRYFSIIKWSEERETWTKLFFWKIWKIFDLEILNQVKPPRPCLYYYLSQLALFESASDRRAPLIRSFAL